MGLMQVKVVDRLVLAMKHEGGSIFDPMKHREVRCLWVESVRCMAEKLGKDFARDLFLCMNDKGGCAVAMWEKRPVAKGRKGVFRVIHALMMHPDKGDGGNLPSMRYMAQRLRPTVEIMDEAMRDMVATEKMEDNAKMASEEQRDEMVKHYRKREGWDSATARMLKSGAMPFVGEEEAALSDTDDMLGLE